jgi:hypothetical protein
MATNVRNHQPKVKKHVFKRRLKKINQPAPARLSASTEPTIISPLMHGSGCKAVSAEASLRLCYSIKSAGERARGNVSVPRIELFL